MYVRSVCNECTCTVCRIIAFYTVCTSFQNMADADRVILSLEEETDTRAIAILKYRNEGKPLKGLDRSFLSRLYGKRRDPDNYVATKNAQRNVRRQIHDAIDVHSGKLILFSLA